MHAYIRTRKEREGSAALINRRRSEFLEKDVTRKTASSSLCHALCLSCPLTSNFYSVVFSLFIRKQKKKRVNENELSNKRSNDSTGFKCTYNGCLFLKNNL